MKHYDNFTITTIMNKQTKNSTEFIGINFRIPRNLYDQMNVITQKTEKSTAAFIAFAVEHYLANVTGAKVSSDTLKIDKFAYELATK